MSGRQEQDEKKELWIKKKLEEVDQIYTDYMRSIKKAKTSSTRKSYLGYLIQFDTFLKENNIDIYEVKPMVIDSYIDYMLENGNKASIINTKLSAIISFYDFLKENDFIKTNPCSSKKKLKLEEKTSVVYMTEDEIAGIKENIITKKYKYANRDLCIITLGCATGLRVSAIVNIDISDINFEEKIITVVEKGNKKREIFIGDNTIDSINRWLHDREEILDGAEEDALFISQKTKKRISTYAVQMMIREYGCFIGKHITPHKMRSTCAMKLYNKTGDIYLTAQQLGHKNIKNTMIYAKATDEKRRMAAELLD